MTAPNPSPFPGLWPCAAAQVFAQFADPKVLHFPSPTFRGGPVMVKLGFFAVCVAPGERVSTELACWP